jgi:hypothetical protein
VHHIPKTKDFSISETEEGMDIEANEEHPLKALFSIG